MAFLSGESTWSYGPPPLFGTLQVAEDTGPLIRRLVSLAILRRTRAKGSLVNITRPAAPLPPIT